MAEASRPTPKSAASHPDPAVDRPAAPEGGRSLGNLPLELSSFVGRGREISEVAVLLGEQRLLTLTGPGGSGKTRLALAVASGLTGRFEDGIWWVDLAPISDPALVTQAVAPLYVHAQDRALYESEIEALRSRLGEAAWNAAWNEGRTMSSEQAIEDALHQQAMPEKGQGENTISPETQRAISVLPG